MISAGAATVVSSQLVYHRLDLLPTDSNCMHFRQLATLSETNYSDQLYDIGVI